jgi:hypothetical protein
MGEESRVQRISAQLRKIIDDRRQHGKKLHQDFFVLDERQQWEFEAGLAGSSFLAVKIRSENIDLREELRQIRASYKDAEETETKKFTRELSEKVLQDAEVAQLKAAIAKAEQVGCTLKEEIAALQSSNSHPSLDVRLHIGFDGLGS